MDPYQKAFDWLYSDKGGDEWPLWPEYKEIPLYTWSSLKGNLLDIFFSAWQESRANLQV